jgi:anti-sigma B factor antagonist
MPHTQFGALVRHRGGVGILDLEGDIDLEAEAGLSAAYAQATADDPKAVLLNFAGVGYINSTGIALIVGLLARARAEGRRVSVYGLSQHYREIFQITRLSDFMAVYTDEEGAIGGLQSANQRGSR